MAAPSSTSRNSLVLLFVPVTVALVFGLFVLPRPVAPDAIPLPAVDGRALGAIEHEDDLRAEQVRQQPLAAEVRELGSAIRSWNEREASDAADAPDIGEARAALDRLLVRVMGDPEALLRLRAFQQHTFLDEVSAYERTGQVSDELKAVGGNFIARMQAVGWVDGSRVILGPHARRAAYKLAWNAVAGVESRPPFALALDENRALYEFYLTHPHAPESARASIALARRSAKDPKACDALQAGELLAAEGWRLDKINRFGAMDEAYPVAFARGVSEYKLRRFDRSAASFEAFLRDHPTGPWSLRARNHLRAALGADDAHL